MQKLHVESDFAATPKEAWDVFECDEFRTRLEAQTGLTCEVLSVNTVDGVEIRELKYTSGSDLPRIAAKALGTKRLSYNQTNKFDEANSRLEWTVNLPVMGDRVKVGGVTTMKPTATGCHRVVDGTIEVKMRLVGGQVEKVVVAEFAKSMGRAVDLAKEILAERNVT